MSLLKSEITLQNSILTLSITCPFVLFLLRYIGSIIFFPIVSKNYNYFQLAFINISIYCSTLTDKNYIQAYMYRGKYRSRFNRIANTNEIDR